MANDHRRGLCKLSAGVLCMRLLGSLGHVSVAYVLSIPQTGYAVDYGEGAQRAIESMLAARAELHSGVFRGLGRDSTVLAEGGEAIDLASEIYCVFDTLGGRLRFERRGQCYVDLRPSKGLTPEVVKEIRAKTFVASPRRRDLIAMFVRSSEYSAEWYAIGKEGEEDSARVNIEIREPGAQPNARRLQPFHPSAAGLFGPTEFLVGKTASEIVAAALAQSSRVELDKQSDGVLDVVFRNAVFKRTVEIDAAKGFTVRHMYAVALDESGQAMALPRIESTASWKQVDGVWVPIHFCIGNYSKDGEVKTHEYVVKWEAVNPEKVSDELFTYQSFKGVWDDVYVFERRGGQRRHVDTIGRPFQPMGMPKPIGLAKEPRSNWRFWLVVVNVIALIVITIFLGFRRMRNAQS